MIKIFLDLEHEGSRGASDKQSQRDRTRTRPKNLQKAPLVCSAVIFTKFNRNMFDDLFGNSLLGPFRRFLEQEITPLLEGSFAEDVRGCRAKSLARIIEQL